MTTLDHISQCALDQDPEDILGEWCWELDWERGILPNACMYCHTAFLCCCWVIDICINGICYSDLEPVHES